jgi:NDP-sugar pyrophosphorylase family protein
MKVIVPMAGLGTRFQAAADENPAYREPKPFISVRGVPMVRWATGSLPFIEHPGQQVESPVRVTPRDLVFIILEDHDKAFNIRQRLSRIYSDEIEVVVLPALTRGAAETAYAARDLVARDDDVIVTDSDHYFNGAALERAIIRSRHTATAGIIPVFVPPHDGIPRWSYSLLDSGSGRIKQVGEKDRALMELGAHANIGAYYFSRAAFFFDTFEKIARENKMYGDEGKKEFYVAPLYQELLNENMPIEAARLEEVWGLGTPQDLDHFLAHSDYAHP